MFVWIFVCVSQPLFQRVLCVCVSFQWRLSLKSRGPSEQSSSLEVSCFCKCLVPILTINEQGFFAFKRLVCYGKPDPVNECQLDALQRTLNGFLFMTFRVGVVFLLFDSFDVFCIYSGVRSTRTMSQNWIDDQGYRIRHEAVVSNRTRVEVGHM